MKPYRQTHFFYGKVVIEFFVFVLFVLIICSNNFVDSITSIPMRSIFLVKPSYWVFLSVSALLFIAGQFFNRKEGSGKVGRCSRLHWLGLHLFVSLLVFWRSPVFASILLLYGSPVFFTWYLYPFFFKKDIKVGAKRSDFRTGVFIFLLSVLYYTVTGYYFTDLAGEHSGDEGHYIIQAKSWWEDKDLDIRNQFEDPENTPRHGSLNSRHGAWYPKHSPGLAFLMALGNPEILLLRHLILGCISALSLTGSFAVARKLGASVSSSILAVLLLGLGLFWGVYSSRALPETLGAALTVWGVFFCFHQKNSPWRSTIAASVCISYLPWTQVRFIPTALVIMGSFGLQGLVVFGFKKENILRLAVFTFLVGILFGFYQYVQWNMYEGGQAYQSEGVLFSYLMGIPHTLLSARGILYTFPLFTCVMWSVLYIAKYRSFRLMSFYGVLLLMSVLLTASATFFYTGGTCVPGRFLAVILPALMSILARALTESNALFRRMTLYLGTVMWMPFVALLSELDSIGRYFNDPFFLQEFHGLLVQTPSFLYNPQMEFQPTSGLLLYVSVGLALFIRKPKLIYFMPVVFTAIFYHSKLFFPIHARRDAEEKTAMILRDHLGGGSIFVRHSSSVDQRNLLEFSDLFSVSGSKYLMHATTEDLGTIVRDQTISVPHIQPNDWESREIRWATLLPPFPSSKGLFAIHYKGELAEGADLELVIREGGTTKIIRQYTQGSKIDDLFSFEVSRQGYIYVLVRFLGEQGELNSEVFRVSPYTEKLLDKAQLVL